MEIYTINPANNRREALIEKFESFIWTDRYSAYGDFEIVAEPSVDMVSRLVPGALVGFDASDRLMVIDSALRAKNAEGKKVLTVKGNSLEAILEERISKRSIVTPDEWELIGTAASIVEELVHTICVIGPGISLSDIIPNLTTIDLTGMTTPCSLNIDPGSLYALVKTICDSYDLGFRITMTPGIATLAFAVYSGTNRMGQGGVAFSEDLENLSETSYLVSKEGYKNVAYVFSGETCRIVTVPGVLNVSGLNRKVILVNADDIDATGLELDAVMDQRGRAALSEHQISILFDGVANPNSAYRYNTDYFLGDLVILRGDDGERREMRVTEHIWSNNAEGLKSYPTLSVIGGVVSDQPTLPAAPSRPAVIGGTPTSATVIFSANGDDSGILFEWEIGYSSIFNPTEPQSTVSAVPLNPLTGTSPTNVITGLTTGTIYTFWARSRNVIGWSPWSEPTASYVNITY